MIKRWSYKNLHGSFDAMQYTLGMYVIYFNIHKKPFAKNTPLLIYFRIGIWHFGDPQYSPRQFVFIFDFLNFQHKEGTDARFYFSFPLTKKKTSMKKYFNNLAKNK